MADDARHIVHDACRVMPVDTLKPTKTQHIKELEIFPYIQTNIWESIVTFLNFIFYFI